MRTACKSLKRNRIYCTFLCWCNMFVQQSQASARDRRGVRTPIGVATFGRFDSVGSIFGACSRPPPALGGARIAYTALPMTPAGRRSSKMRWVLSPSAKLHRESGESLKFVRSHFQIRGVGSPAPVTGQVQTPGIGIPSWREILRRGSLSRSSLSP